MTVLSRMHPRDIAQNMFLGNTRCLRPPQGSDHNTVQSLTGNSLHWDLLLPQLLKWCTYCSVLVFPLRREMIRGSMNNLGQSVQKKQGKQYFELQAKFQSESHPCCSPAHSLAPRPFSSTALACHPQEPSVLLLLSQLQGVFSLISPSHQIWAGVVPNFPKHQYQFFLSPLFSSALTSVQKTRWWD